MYHMYKKSGKTSQMKDCFAAQTKYWFLILAVLITVSVICAIAASHSHQTVYSSAVESFPQGGQLQTIALTECPYCNGVLDNQGRCNIKGCQIYSPNWGSQNFQARNAALTKCPYCNGVLDNQGRCNIKGCRIYSPNWGSQNFQTRDAAAAKCPYCNGILDAQGRCNQMGCSIYSSNWGKPSSAEGIPVKKVLIRELAAEVAATKGKSTVIIQSVYIGGNAQKAGMKAGDRIVRFNGRNVKSVKQFQSFVARAQPESTVKIKVIRDGEKVKAAVFVGEGEMEGATPPPSNGP